MDRMTSHNTRHQFLAFVIALLGFLALLSWSRNPSLEEQVKAQASSDFDGTFMVWGEQGD